MKFIFLASGDYIEFEPPKSKFVESWFEYIFNSNLNLDYVRSSSATIDSTKSSIFQLNDNINYVNKFSKEHSLGDDIRFDNCFELDQQWLNTSHKKWVFLNNKYGQKINGNHLKSSYPAFDNAWQSINHNIHSIEGWWSIHFKNNKIWMFPDNSTTKITQEDCTFDQNDLVLEFDNLGKHQFDQWATGAELDEETNNYERISANFRYIHKYFYTNTTPAPAEYVDWCQKRNVPILPNWVKLGKFPKYDVWTVKKLMYKNLIVDRRIGFVL
jgi:hypothetical protein